MLQRYLIAALGDEIFTDQVKSEHGLTGFDLCTADEYLQSIRELEVKIRQQEPRFVYRAPFVFNPKKSDTADQPPVKHQRPSGPREKPIGKRQQVREEKAALLEKWKAEDEARQLEAMRNKPIWSFYKVMAIAAGTYIKGLEAGMGSIPEELWDEKAQDAIAEARKIIANYHEYETQNKKP